MTKTQEAEKRFQEEVESIGGVFVEGTLYALLVLARLAWEADQEEERVRLDKKEKLQGIRITDAPCIRCGSPARSKFTDENERVASVDYWCGAKLRLGGNGLYEFDGLCRNAATTTFAPVVHYEGIAALSSEDRAKLESGGYIVVETQPGCTVHVMNQGEPLASAEEIGMAALEAMLGPTNDSVLAKFAELLFKKLSARRKS